MTRDHQQKIGILLWLGIMLTPLVAIAQAPTDAKSVSQGKVVFAQTCRWCHGAMGKGNGPAAFFIGAYSSPRPRDFTGDESYKFRSTPSGELPTDEDLFRIITRGIPGYMPSFAGLSPVERWQVIAYIKSLNPEFEETPLPPLVVGMPRIPPSPESLRRGQEVYQTFECDACHGTDARGVMDLSFADELHDTRGLHIRPTDLTAPTSFKNGHSPREIAMSIVTGLDGTPMSAFAEAFADSSDDLWHLVNYIRSLSNETW